jgi:hypothetical protein
MYKKFSQLSFVIGLFFSIVALILFANTLLNRAETNALSLSTAIVFLIFGLAMMLAKNKNADEH